MRSVALIRKFPLMVTLRDGTLYVPALNLWLDSMLRRDRSYVSHGHADHARPHGTIVTTPVNGAICAARFGMSDPNDPLKVSARLRKTTFELHPFHESWTVGEHRMTLFPAGHIFGSSQLMIEGEVGRFVYTGDFKLAEGLTVEKTVVERCDILLMESTFGRPQYAFPPREEITAAICAFARSALENNATPIFFAYSLGKAQETMAILRQADIPLAVHSTIHTMTKVYAKYGMNVGSYHTVKNDAEIIEPAAVIWPPSVRWRPRVRGHRTMQSASLTGWALDRSDHRRLRTDRSFPLSDHADFPALLRYVELAQPRYILVNHGSKSFVTELRRRGFHADFLEANGQLSFL